MIDQYFDGFSSKEDVFSQFGIPVEEWNDIQIHFAWYECHYEGQAAVLYSRNGKFCLVESSHCSCYDLDGTWDDTMLDFESLKKIAAAKSVLNYKDFGSELLIKFCEEYNA